MLTLTVQKLDPAAKLPAYGSEHAAGFDIAANLGWGKSLVLYPRLRYSIQTGLAFAVPSGHYLRIAPRSGLAVKNGIDVLAGVVDEDYRGEVIVVLLNTGSEEHRINHGDRIAQGIIERIAHVAISEAGFLPDSVRGAGGFGSTGA